MRVDYMFQLVRFSVSPLAVLLLILMLTSACSSKSKYDRTGFDPEKICANTENTLECARAVEKALIGIYPDIAARDNSVLYLKLNNGETVVLADTTNNTGEEESVRYFSLIDYLEKEKIFLVEEQWWEGGTYQLIDRRTGVMTEVMGPPTFSPKRDFFVAEFGDLETGYDVNGLEIWTLNSKDELLKVFELYPDDWAPDTIRWISDNTLEVNRLVYDDEGVKQSTPIRINRVGAKWSVDAKTPIKN